MFKVKYKLTPEIASDILTRRTNNHNNLRHINHFETAFINGFLHINGIKRNRI